MEGWIKLHRSIEANKMWTSEAFSRGQAWVDLLLLANHSDSFYYKRGYKVNVKRGQLGRSIVELSDRWRWSRGKVQRFLNDLKNEHQIEQQNNNVTTIISILNYDMYQGNGQQIEQQTDTKQAADGQQTNTYKNVKNDNNGKEFKEKKLIHKEFYRLEFEKTKGNPMQHKYYFIIKYIYNIEENVIGESGEHILKLNKQLSFEQFIKLHEYCSKRATSIKEMIDSWLNKPSYSTGRISVYAVLQKWAQKSPMSGTNFQDNKAVLVETSIGKQK